MGSKKVSDYVTNPSYSQDDWDDVSDSPTFTAEDLRNARTGRELLPPEFFDALEKRRQGQRGPQKAPTKQLVTMRLDRDLLEKLKADGPGWQSRVNAMLRKAVGC